MTRLGLTLPMLDRVSLGLSLLLHSFTWFGFVLAVIDYVHTGSMSFLQSFGYLSLLISVLDFLHLGLMLPLQFFAQPGTPFSLFGIGCMGLTITALDCVHLDSAIFTRSSVYSEFSMLVPDFLHLDLSLPSQFLA